MIPDVPKQYKEFVDKMVIALADAGDGIWCIIGELGSDRLVCEGENVIVTVEKKPAKKEN